ncbi:MAG: peptide deformylase [Candidatus Krumholzibacteriota bacterium]|nr:peptide deformylase [Candidatus Krumholzibacteriota bacterium]
MKDIMMIRTYGDKVLRRQGAAVEEFDAGLVELLGRMLDTMMAAEGVGLAAPQVGISKQVAVVNPEPGNPKTLLYIVNPRMTSCSEETESVEEGCLSVPEVRGKVERPVEIELEYQDESGKEHRLTARGLLARIIQHEIDHLNGVLFVDRLSFGKRTMIKGKLKQLAASQKNRGR